MRPRKRILVLDRDEERLRVTRFVLDCAGFRVVTRDDAEKHGADLAVGFAPVTEAETAEAGRRLGCSSLAVRDKQPEFGECATNWWLVNPETAELLEQIRIMLVGKRGPKRAGESVESLVEVLG